VAHLRSPIPIRRSLIAALAAAITLVAAASYAQPSAPGGWLEASINGGAGAWSVTDDGFSVEGAGTDIWDSADSFHFVYQVLNGDGEFRARVVSVQGAEDWTKVGLMIRQSLDPDSAHHFLLASKGRGLNYQRRLTTGGTSLSTLLAYPTTAIWYRIVRAGAQVQLGMSSDGVNWKTVATVDWPTGPTYIGFAVTSHDASTTPAASGLFDGVALTGNGRSAPDVTVVVPSRGYVMETTNPATIQWQANSTDGDIIEYFDVFIGVEQDGVITYEPVPGCTRVPGDARSCVWNSPRPATDAAHVLVRATDHLTDQGSADSGRFYIEAPQTGSLPPGWTGQDIGAVSAAGSSYGDSSETSGAPTLNFTVTGSGADIWGTSDAFQFTYTSMSGDFSITAHITSVQNVNAWTKAGLMIRDGLSPGAVHGSFFATPSTTKGTAFQFRPSENGTSSNVTGPDFAPPVWLKLVRRGPTITAYYRHSITDLWSMLQYQVFDGGLSDTLQVGFAVSSHVDGTLATANFEDVVVEHLLPWQFAQIASQAYGSTDETVFGVAGQGADIWGTADALAGYFVPWVGAGTMTARIRGLDPSDDWAKAGIMFRESLTSGSKHVFALLSPGHGLNLQYRPTDGGQSAQASGGGVAGAAPLWLRVIRQNDTFYAEASSDFTNWKLIGSVTVPMNQTIYVGIAHTSHNPGDPGGTSFDDMRITR
jgi:regulation of enolase protein 1 (concanavalin A-like superfamily)